MSSEQIIRSWKDEEKNEQGNGATEATEKESENPAGEQELNSEELEKIEGGMVPGSCIITSC